MKLVKLINAAGAISKVAQSSDLSAGYVWDILDFVKQAQEETRKFDKMRAKIVEDTTKEVAGEPMINAKEYNKQLLELFDKEIELDCSVINVEEIKKVKGLTVTEVLAIKELLQE